MRCLIQVFQHKWSSTRPRCFEELSPAGQQLGSLVCQLDSFNLSVKHTEFAPTVNQQFQVWMSEQVSAVCCSDSQSAEDSLLTAFIEPFDAQDVIAAHASGPKVHAGIPLRRDGWLSVSGEGVPCGRRDDNFINEVAAASTPDSQREKSLWFLNQRLFDFWFWNNPIWTFRKTFDTFWDVEDDRINHWVSFKMN